MGCLHLDDGELRAVRELIAQTEHTRHLRRALAILWLCEGESPVRVARRLCVSRATVYNWAARYKSRAALAPAARVADGPRSGRPRSKPALEA
jgi:transposase